MLLELHQPFLMLDEQAAWDAFDLVVLPDTYVMTPANAAKAEKFLAGGAIIAAGTALLDEKHEKFAIDRVRRSSAARRTTPTTCCHAAHAESRCSRPS